MAHKDSTIKAGYYGVAGSTVAQHTFVVAEHASGTYVMPCFGWYAFHEGHHGASQVVYPAELWTPYIVGSKSVGHSASANLHVALGMAQFTANPAYNWKVEDWEKSNPTFSGLVSTSGIVYGVTGVCQQATNRVLLSIGSSPLDTSPVCWPPSFSATYWVYGFLGKDTPVALLLAQSLFAQAEAGRGHRVHGKLHRMAEDSRMESLQAQQTESLQGQLDVALSPEQRIQQLQPMLASLGEEKREELLDKPQRVLEPDLRFQEVKRELDRMLLAGTLRNQEYADQVNAAAQVLFTELKDRLPAEDYARLFPRFDPAQHARLINPELMPSSYEEVREHTAVEL